MAFGKRRQLDAELLELVRNELETLRSEIQSTLGETVAAVSARVCSEIDLRMGEPSALVAGIQGVREGMSARDSELAQVLRRVAETCDALTERVQLDRIDRAALVEAVNRLTTTLAIAGTLPAQIRSTVIGGTVDPAQAPSVIPTGAASGPDAGIPELSEPPTEIDLEAEARVPETAPTATASPVATPAPTDIPGAARPLPRDGVEVRCRFGDRWVTGFEVCEVIRFDDETRYRLRRRSDGSVLPTMFDEKDLRFFSTAYIDH